MLRWLRSLLAPAGAVAGSGPKQPASSVWFDAHRIGFRQPDGSERTLGWEDLASVTIVTTDAGPFEVDLHWVLVTAGRGAGLSVPMGAAGEQDLLRELQRRLLDFDSDAVIRAMGSTASATFVVWRRPASPTVAT